MNTFTNIQQRTQQLRSVVRTKAEKADRREQVKNAEKVAELTDDTITQEVVDAQKKTSASIGGLVSLITKSTGREQDIESAITMSEEHIKTAEDVQVAAEEVARLQNFHKAQLTQTELRQKEELFELENGFKEDKAEWVLDDKKFNERAKREEKELSEDRKTAEATSKYEEQRNEGHCQDTHDLAKRRIETDVARTEADKSADFKQRRANLKDSAKEITKMEGEIDKAEKKAEGDAKTAAKEAGSKAKAECEEEATLLAAQNTAAVKQLELRLEIAKGNLLREQKRGQELQSELKTALQEGNNLAKAAVSAKVPEGGAQ